MKVKTLNSKWIHEANYRLDSNPYMTGAIEARVIIKAAQLVKHELVNVTKGGMKGLINPGRIKRIWAKSNEYGIDFLSSTDILKKNLSYISAISKKAVSENPKLIINYGDILITRAGSIGRMAFTRKDIDGFACTEDVLRVVADESKISNGYLYAYLRSKFGVPLIISSTYGAIIQHIEPHHLADLPVPRLSDLLELKVNNLILEASDLRTKANKIIEESKLKICELIGEIEHLTSTDVLNCNVISSFDLRSSKRLDVLYYAKEPLKIITKLKNNEFRLLKEVSSVVKPGMFKRIMSTKENNGIPFYTGSELFLTDLKPKYYVSKKTQHIEQCILQENWILLQAFGQRGGLIGRAMLTTPKLKNAAATDLQIQIKLPDKFDAGFILAFLDSKPGYSTVVRTPVGGSIPHINPRDIENLVVPWPSKAIRNVIGENVLIAWQSRDKAQELEEEAIKIVENSIEAAAPKH
ncbi:methylation-associated defense system restriction endonuclease subunit S MAD5 [Brumicola nitratireducens]|uniref:Type I restriction-modification system S subunit putative n=1 Tax=Glaciecola nitratireducens (strain JCM 12485 / KCTC 12276 / FR1064) TaxID=1085623 RepID=G4QL07_GLANF|nr:restriction endonuclease subunit S [Glaciecola nitratireducens]AEP29397.1 type I restriction-modification system S subunit putative [Glaciecola nitratireducens FR1064]